MKRRELRENIFKLLFVSLFTDREEMPEQLRLYFEGIEQLEEKDRTYMETKVDQVLARAEETDRLLNQVSRGWKTSRMNRVDLTILRLAVYEMRYDDSVPVSVAINEAVELGKRFGGDDSGSFINGILGKIAAMDEREKEPNAAVLGDMPDAAASGGQFSDGPGQRS
ncbi:MAG TPA: transcription antitermination factor NusB [Lachnospiraceae bacterium]|nr:transcription antitermination factor NusB [Lachnospiraceae bacterium]